MRTCTINGKKISVPPGTTLLQAAAELGFDIPHFCYHPALSRPANCRMCLVEVERARKLLPACYTEAGHPLQGGDKMVVHTESPRVIQARRAVLEFILVNHPVDCPICDQAGECKLQDYYMEYDMQESRLRTPKVSKIKVYPIGPEVVYDGERCILCTRCVRFCDEISGTNELTVVERGDRSEIRTFPGMELDNAYSMCTVDLCPVGALTSRDFRFKCRVWLLTSTDSICTGCSRACSIHLEHHRDEVQRYRPRYNPEVNDYWMCDSGRLSYTELHEDRIPKPLIDGAAYTWPLMAEETSERIKKQLFDNPSSFAFVVSPQAACEDLFLASRFAKEVLETENIYMGGKPSGEADDFLIEADKNPNSNGLLLMFPKGQRPKPFSQLIDDIASGSITALYMMGSELPLSAKERDHFLELLPQLELFALQAPRSGGLPEYSTQSTCIVLPATTHAEQEGTYINCDGVVQHTNRGFAPFKQARPHWRIFMTLAQKMGTPLSYTFLKALRDDMWKTIEANAQGAPEAAEVAEAAAP